MKPTFYIHIKDLVIWRAALASAVHMHTNPVFQVCSATGTNHHRVHHINNPNMS